MHDLAEISVADSDVSVDSQHVLNNNAFISADPQQRVLEQQRRVSEAASAGQKIEEYHMRLSNLSTQAMLLIGAVLVPMGAETLQSIGDTSSPVCL
jgi:hypothetical protein